MPPRKGARARKPPAKVQDDDTTAPKAKKAKAAPAAAPVVATATATAVGPITADDIPANTFCITGTLSRSRAEIEAEIQGFGGKLAKSVTASVTILVCNQSGTKKCLDAAAKGVRVVDEAWLQERLDNDGFHPGSKATTKGNAKGKGKGKAKAKAAPKAAAAQSAAAPAAKRAKKGAGAGAIGCGGGVGHATMVCSEPPDSHIAQATTNDDAAAVANGCVVLLMADSEAMNATLTCIEPAKNSDKFYILQCLSTMQQSPDGCFYVYSRYGRTGSEGQKNLKGPMQEDEAVDEFKKIFKDKVGREWESRRQPPAKKKAGKYGKRFKSGRAVGVAGWLTTATRVFVWTFPTISQEEEGGTRRNEEERGREG